METMNLVLIQRVYLVMIVTFLSGSKQSDSSDDKYNVNDDNDMQHKGRS
jgi:hypothetical protein